MLVIDELEGKGWFASDRFQPENKVMIYIFKPNKNVTILESDDEEYIRQFARLKQFDKVTVVSANKNPVQSPDLTRMNEHTINFPVYGNIVYTRKSDFKNPQALYLWKNFEDGEHELSQMKQKLENLRADYARAADEEKKQIAPQIITLEQSIGAKEKSIESMELQIRNEEIKYLRK
jgi:hypothetical protein